MLGNLHELLRVFVALKASQVCQSLREGGYPFLWRMRSQITFNTEKHIFKKYPSIRRLSWDMANREEPRLSRGTQPLLVPLASVMRGR